LDLGVEGPPKPPLLLLLLLLLLLVVALVLSVIVNRELPPMEEDSAVVGVSTDSDLAIGPGDIWIPYRCLAVWLEKLQDVWELALSLKALRLASGLLELSGMLTSGTFLWPFRTFRIPRTDRRLWFDDPFRVLSLLFRCIEIETKLTKLALLTQVGASLT